MARHWVGGQVQEHQMSACLGHLRRGEQCFGKQENAPDISKADFETLIENGIQDARLKSSGVGPDCPVESNRTEEGKAKNRRVELVEMF